MFAGEQAGAVEVEEDLNAEDDEGEVEDALAEAAEAPATAGDVAPDVKVEWKGASVGQDAGHTFYKYSPTFICRLISQFPIPHEVSLSMSPWKFGTMRFSYPLWN